MIASVYNSLKEVHQAQGALQVLRMLGVTSGEMSYREARDTYGKWFVTAVAQGRIKPCRVGNGTTGGKFYAISEILALQEEDWGGAKINL